MLDTFTKAYIDCALWASVGDDGQPMDDTYVPDDIAPEALATIEEDCAQFQRDNAELLAAAYQLYTVRDDSSPEAYAGHDLWLTRNHHGAGFWDRGLGDVGDKLTDAAEAMGECDLYVGDALREADARLPHVGCGSRTHPDDDRDQT